MSLPVYADWQAAKPALHQAAQILNAARLIGLGPLPNALRHSLRPIAEGATTGRLDFGAALTLDYTQGAIVITGENGEEITQVSLNGNSQESLFNTVFAALAQADHPLEPDRSKITSSEPFDLDLTQAQLFAQVQYRLFQTLATVKASMLGAQTPLVLWPHGFDLSMLWFARGFDEQADPHLNFGFSPGTPDIGQPYAYFYAYPALETLRDHLPEIVTWTTDWSTPGGYIPYERFVNETQPEQLLIDVLVEVYHAAARLMQA